MSTPQPIRYRLLVGGSWFDGFLDWFRGLGTPKRFPWAMPEGSDLVYVYVEAMGVLYLEFAGDIWHFAVTELVRSFDDKRIPYYIVTSPWTPLATWECGELVEKEGTVGVGPHGDFRSLQRAMAEEYEGKTVQ